MPEIPSNGAIAGPGPSTTAARRRVAKETAADDAVKRAAGKGRKGKRAASGLDAASAVDDAPPKKTRRTHKERHSCPVADCKAKRTRDTMRHHLAQHVLEGDLPTSSCPFCGSTGTECRPALCGQGDRRLADDCCSLQPTIKNLAAARKPSKAAPSTNLPVRCVRCNAFVWRYNLQHHYDEAHDDVRLPSQRSAKENESIVISARERSLLKPKEKGESKDDE